MDAWVGEFPSIAKAAQALYRDPKMLSRLRTPFNEDPAVYEPALKRELFAIMAVFSELVMQDIEGVSAESAGPLGLAFVPSESGDVLPVDEDMLGAASLRPMAPPDWRAGDFFQQVAALQVLTAKHLIDAEHSGLNAPELAPLVARAAELLDTVPSRFRGGRDDGESDLSYVFRTAITAYGTAPIFASDLLRTFPQSVAADHPLVTVDELMDISRRSTGLVRTTAGGSSRRFANILNQLHTSPGEEPDYKYRDTDPIDPRRLDYRPADGNKIAAADADKPPFAMPRDSKVPTTPSGYIDLDAIPDGCPGRIAVRPGKLPPLLRAYACSVKLAELHWKLTVPGVRPIDLGSLEPPIDDRTEFRELKLRNIDTDVQVLPSATGRITVEYTGTAPLTISATADGLSISSRGSMASPSEQQTERPKLVIRTPQRLRVQAEKVPRLDLDYVHTIRVDVPENGRLRAAPAAGSRVTAQAGSRTLLVDEYPGASTLRGPGAVVALNQEPTALGAENPARWKAHQNGNADLDLWHMTPADVAALPAEVRTTLAENAGWILRHTSDKHHPQSALPRSTVNGTCWELGHSLKKTLFAANPRSETRHERDSTVGMRPKRWPWGRARGRKIRP